MVSGDQVKRKESVLPLPIELSLLIPKCGTDGKELVEMGDSNLRHQEQANMQNERSLVELEERERDVRQLEVSAILIRSEQTNQTH